MLQIQRIVSYICMFQVIFQHFGTLAATVSMNQNITGLLGSNDTHLTCSFILEKGEQIVSVQLIAKNITEDFDDKPPIAIFEPKNAAKLLTSGTYLSDRVTLTNITNRSTNATLTFHRLEYTDEQNYMCKLFYYDMVKVITTRESEATRISVKGTQAAKVSINHNITGLLGNIDINLTCSFVQEKEEKFLNVEIIAKNLTGDFVDVKKPIAIFQPDTAAKLHSSGDYLKGRVALTNITNTSTNATLKFHILKCTDEKDYMCKYNFIDMDGAVSFAQSETTRILVKVPVRDVYINNQPNQAQYDSKTDNITLTCKASGDPEPKYKWFKEDNKSDIISMTNIYVIKDVIQNNSGVYICEAYNNINNVYHKLANSVEIDIVDKFLPLPKSALSKISAVFAACAVPLIIAVGLIVICHAVRKHRSNRSEVEKNKKENCGQNIVDFLMSCHGLTKKSDYTSVVGKSNNDAEGESEDVSNGIKKNKFNCGNKEVDPVKTGDFIQNMPTTSSNIYADPKDTLPAGIIKDGGKCEDNGASDQSAVYSEVIDQANMKYEMSNSRTSVTPYNVDHNEHHVPEDQCHD